jgi:hypothetical protein
MNIYTVRDNLIRTIRGKEEFLAKMRDDVIKYNQTVNYTVCKYLEVNLEELYGILNDVQECCKQASDDSWRDNPDRMGGQFTQEEVDRPRDW